MLVHVLGIIIYMILVAMSYSPCCTCFSAQIQGLLSDVPEECDEVSDLCLVHLSHKNCIHYIKLYTYEKLHLCVLQVDANSYGTVVVIKLTNQSFFQFFSSL